MCRVGRRVVYFGTMLYRVALPRVQSMEGQPRLNLGVFTETAGEKAVFCDENQRFLNKKGGIL